MLPAMSRRLRVLIVEDDADLRRMFRHALTIAGIECLEASDGMEALRALDRDPPDAIVLDLGLPVVSGRVVRQETAAQAHLRTIPVIIVTGQVVDPATLDVACVLRKPVTAEELIVTIRRCVAAGSSFSGC